MVTWSPTIATLLVLLLPADQDREHQPGHQRTNHDEVDHDPDPARRRQLRLARQVGTPRPVVVKVGLGNAHDQPPQTPKERAQWILQIAFPPPPSEAGIVVPPLSIRDLEGQRQPDVLSSHAAIQTVPQFVSAQTRTRRTPSRPPSNSPYRTGTTKTVIRAPTPEPARRTDQRRAGRAPSYPLRERCAPCSPPDRVTVRRETAGHDRWSRERDSNP
jgi:hypothetical protein